MAYGPGGYRSTRAVCRRTGCRAVPAQAAGRFVGGDEPGEATVAPAVPLLLARPVPGIVAPLPATRSPSARNEQ